MENPRINEYKISLTLRNTINDLQQILSEIEGKSAQKEAELEDKLIELIDSSPNGIEGKNIVNSLKNDGISKKFADIKLILNKLFKEEKIAANPRTFGKTKSAPIINKTILLPKSFKKEHIPETIIKENDEIINIPSFYSFVKNLNHYVNVKQEFGRRLPISEVISFCKEKEKNLTKSTFIQYLQDVNLLFPESFRIDPAGEQIKSKNTIIIRGIKYSHIVILKQLI